MKFSQRELNYERAYLTTTRQKLAATGARGNSMVALITKGEQQPRQTIDKVGRSRERERDEHITSKCIP